jgi:hypothetical protein
MVDGIPLFAHRELSVEQQAELAHDRVFVKRLHDGYHLDRSMYDWATPWLDGERLSHQDAVLLCLGGAFSDDLPEARAANKFNVDHLAHTFPEFAAGIVAGQDTTFISCAAERCRLRREPSTRSTRVTRWITSTARSRS